MEDLALIECIERVRTHVAEEHFALAQRLSALGQLSLQDVSPQRMKEIVVSLALDLDPADPAARRRLRSVMADESMASYFTDVLAETKNRGLPASASPQMRETNSLVSKRDEILASLAALGHAADQGPASQFLAQLARCANLLDAAQTVERTLPVLRGQKAYQFLIDIGYPAAVPSLDTMRMLHRLGALSSPGTDSASRRRMLETMQRISRLSGLTLGQVDLLLGYYSGARAEARGNFRALCVPQPRCHECSLVRHCNFVKLNGLPEQREMVPIKKWAYEERPRERMLSGERLSTAELLAIILRTGSGDQSALDLGRALLHKFGSLHELERASVQDITRVKGIGPAKAVEIKAAIELGRRITQPAADARDGLKQVNSSRDIFDMCRPRYKSATQEEFLLLALNTKNRIQKEILISQGTLNSSIVHPRDVFNHALREAAAGVIFVHNHPSGDPTPSPEDHALTRRLVEAGNLLGIKVLDHVVVGAQRYFSFADEGMLG